MKNKVQLIGTIVGVLLFIALIAGFTYAYLLTRTEKTLTTGSGKFSIDYAIVQNITASSLSPSTSKTDGLHGIVKAKLSTGSVSGKFNIYITPTTIAGLNTSDVLRYEVYVNGSSTATKTGTFNGVSANTAVKVLDSYNLASTSTYTNFDIYIWLDNAKVTSDVIGKTFAATISADSTAVTGEF